MAHNYIRIWSAYEATMLEDMDRAITECQLWNWLKEFEPDEGKGFMFTEHPNLDTIVSKLRHNRHSGSSFAWCMRNMQSVAKLGWERYCQDIVASRQFDGITQAFASSSDPERQKQAEAMKKFKDGELSYAEMRALCG